MTLSKLAFQAIFVLLIVVLVDYLVVKINLKIKNKKTSKSIIRESFLKSVFMPLRFIVWIWGAYFIVSPFFKFLGMDSIIDLLKTLRSLSCVIVAGWFLMKWEKRFELTWAEKKRTHEISPGLRLEVVSKLSKIAILFIISLMILDSINIQFGTILAVGGIFVTGMTFAAKDIIANFFSGIMIHMTQPFFVGDWIKSPDRDMEGIVEDIGWYVTKIMGFDRIPLYVPNSIFSNIIVSNPEQMDSRRIKEEITVRYEDVSTLGDIFKDIENMLSERKDINQTKTKYIALSNFKDSILSLTIYAFTIECSLERYSKVKSDVLIDVVNILKKNSVNLACPTQTIKISK